jgi:hypothetical protein
MTQDDLAQLSREELIQIILAQAEQLPQLIADYEALRLKLEKGKKPPTNSSNSILAMSVRKQPCKYFTEWTLAKV